jgi:hypothetical protein
VGRIRRREDAGAAAIVLPSIFEEQIAQAVREHAPDFDLWGFPEVAP